MNIKIKMITSLEEQLIIKAKVEDRAKELERQIGEVCHLCFIRTISMLFDHLLICLCVFCAFESTTKPLNLKEKPFILIMFAHLLFTCRFR